MVYCGILSTAHTSSQLSLVVCYRKMEWITRVSRMTQRNRKSLLDDSDFRVVNGAEKIGYSVKQENVGSGYGGFTARQKDSFYYPAKGFLGPKQSPPHEFRDVGSKDKMPNTEKVPPKVGGVPKQT
ncbi:hypothetical protein ACOSQ3_011241 [Xanthoceras sorbifolium]